MLTARYVLVVFFAIFGIGAIVIASNIGPLTEQEEYLDYDTPIMVTQKLVEDNFLSTSSLKESLVVRLNWGVKGLDRSDVGAWDPKDMGELIWDEDFNVAPKANQQNLIDLCIDLRDNNEFVKDNEVRCWILDMNEWLKQSYDIELPLDDEEQFNSLLLEFAFTDENGIDLQRDFSIGFDAKTNRLKYMNISAQSIGNIRDSRE